MPQGYRAPFFRYGPSDAGAYLSGHWGFEGMVHGGDHASAGERAAGIDIRVSAGCPDLIFSNPGMDFM